MLRVLKANSSKWVNEEKSRLQKFGWQDGYAAFTVSQSIASVPGAQVHPQSEASSPQSGFPERVEGIVGTPWRRV
jgi:hypothetical protein